jgi:TRAP-type mannitol/chloroaromatic compound transport system substrate-binding protein
MLKRRHFLTAPLLASPALAQNIRRLRMVTSWPKNLVGPGVSAERLAKRISLLTQGKLEVQVFAANELVPAFGVFDAVRDNTVEMGHSAAFFWAGKEPAMHYFTSIPFGFSPQEHEAWLFSSGQKLWDELYAAHHIKPFLGGNTGVSMGGWFKKPLTELKGLKIRMAGLGGELFTRMGATALALPPAEIYPALEKGAIDAAEFTSPASDERLGLYKVAPYYYGKGFTKPNGASELLMNKGIYDALPSDFQHAIEAASQAEQSLALAQMDVLNVQAMKRLIAQGTKLMGFSPDFLAKAKVEALQLRQELRSRSPTARKVGDDYEAFAQEQGDWWQILK